MTRAAAAIAGGVLAAVVLLAAGRHAERWLADLIGRPA